MLEICVHLGRVVVLADFPCSVIHAHECTLLKCLFQCYASCENEFIVPDKQKNVGGTE